jgi:hypothetical protein
MILKCNYNLNFSAEIGTFDHNLNFLIMKKTLGFFLVLALIPGTMLNAQRMVLKSGSLDFLKGQSSILVKYDYSNMAVGKFAKEEEYIAKKKSEYNEKEAGRGDKWAQAWVDDREAKFEPKFEELFNNYCSKKGLSCSKTATNAEYVMVVHTLFTEPGFNIGVMRQNAYIDAEISFRRISDNEEVALITADNCPGMGAMGYDFDTGGRIAESYAKLGKSLAGWVLKALK